jgi:uncharacterized membrane protein
MPLAKDRFSPEELKKISDAITLAEEKTSGEIRVHIEQFCKEEVLDHAAFVFETLQMHKTEFRNGVLIYVAIDDHKFAILGDAGINAVVPPNFWEAIKAQMLADFKNQEIAEGISKAVLSAGKALAEHFPPRKESKNELSNDVSFK